MSNLRGGKGNLTSGENMEVVVFPRKGENASGSQEGGDLLVLSEGSS